MPDSNKVGERLKELRLSKGITQNELSKLIGISLSAVTNYELGTRIPRDEIKIKLANYYEVSVDYIFFS